MTTNMNHFLDNSEWAESRQLRCVRTANHISEEFETPEDCASLQLVPFDSCTVAALMDKFDLQGIAAATFTPMKPNGDINTSIVGEYVTYLVENQGVTSIFLNGTSGEGMSLSTAERKKLLEAWLCAGRNRLKYIIVNISCSSITDCKELAKHAEQVGASAVAITSPSYFCPATPDALVDFLHAVSLEAGSLPIIYYHIPVMSHIPFLASTILEAIGNKIPNFAGFKFSDLNLFDASLCMHNSGRRCALYYGVDEQMLTGMLMGAQAAIGSTYNYLGSKNIEMLSLLQNEKFQDALNIQGRSFYVPAPLTLINLGICDPEESVLLISLQKHIASISKTGITVPENKVIMSYISGLDMGPPRSPLTACGASRTSQLHRAVDSLQSLSRI